MPPLELPTIEQMLRARRPDRYGLSYYDYGEGA
jgi:hypothetical protein